jgi:hypothetical protein
MQPLGLNGAIQNTPVPALPTLFLVKTPPSPGRVHADLACPTPPRHDILDGMGPGLGLFLGTWKGRVTLSAAYNEAWHRRSEVLGAIGWLYRRSEAKRSVDIVLLVFILLGFQA